MRYYFVRFMLAILLSVVISPNLSVADMTVSGSPIVGDMPVMITAFANPSTGDVYPAGGTDRYVFTYFDTGSTRVVLDSGTASFLGLNNGASTDVRINGLAAIQDGTLYAPIYLSPPNGPPQAQVLGVGLKVDTGLAATLIGGPVTNNVTAVIDYTSTITKGPYPGDQYASGPDITFYQSPSSPGYTPAIQVSLGRAYQTFTDNDGVSHGQTYLMYNVAFNEGVNSVASPGSGDLNLTETKFLYDTGSNVTLVSPELAMLLGYSQEFTQSVGGVDYPGFYLDSLTMTGLGGMYTVLNAPVVVYTPIGFYDAIIGSNVFETTKILFDGTGNILGIGVSGTGPEVPEPCTMILLGSGLLGLAGLRKKFKK
jgi:hypothetical protein